MITEKPTPQSSAVEHDGEFLDDDTVETDLFGEVNKETGRESVVDGDAEESRGAEGSKKKGGVLEGLKKGLAGVTGAFGLFR